MSLTPALAASARTRSISCSRPPSHIQSFHSLLQPLMCPRPMFLLLICERERRRRAPRSAWARLGVGRGREGEGTDPQRVGPRDGRAERTLCSERSKRVAHLELAVAVAIEELGSVERGEAELGAVEEELAAAALDKVVCKSDWVSVLRCARARASSRTCVGHGRGREGEVGLRSGRALGVVVRCGCSCRVVGRVRRLGRAGSHADAGELRESERGGGRRCKPAADLAMTEVRTLDRIDKLNCGAQCTVGDGRELQKGDERNERREPRVRRRRRERARRRESERGEEEDDNGVRKAWRRRNVQRRERRRRRWRRGRECLCAEACI